VLASTTGHQERHIDDDTADAPGTLPASEAKEGAAAPGPGDQAATRILLVAETLFAQRGYENVTVRDVAAAAGVTHPLIYYHWGSKRGLLAAVLARHQTKMRTLIDMNVTARDAVLELVRENLEGSRLYLLMLSRAFLDHMPAGDWPGGFPAVDAAVERLRRAGPAAAPRWDEEARGTAAVVTAMLAGWVLMEDQLLEIVGLPPSCRGMARDRLIQYVDTVLRVALESGAR